MLGLFSFIFSVANGEPPIGIPWETFQKYAKNTYSFMKGVITMKVYVVLGYQDLCQNGNIECDGVYGVFSTEELAQECVGYLTEELEYMNHFEIEEINLDEFGYK